MKVVASILPKDMNINAPGQFDHMSDEELLAHIEELDEQIRPFIEQADTASKSSRTKH